MMILILLIGLLTLGIDNNVRAQAIAPPSDGLYFTLNGAVYLPGATILITDVGDSFSGDTTNPTEPGPSLVCNTSNVNTNCCRGADHPGSGAVGDWLYPNDTIIDGNGDNALGYITRSSHIHQIRLNRKRPDVMSLTGVYTCEVPDGVDTAVIHKADITLSLTLPTTMADTMATTMADTSTTMEDNMATTMTDTSTTSTIASTTSPLVVTISVSGGTFTAGTSHSLTCTASGGASMTYTYEWLRNDVVLSNQDPPNMYSFSTLREADAGRYNCQVSDTTSDGVMINVVAPTLTVEITPTDSSPLTEGQTYSLTCAIRGIESLQVTMPILYQWTKNGVPGIISSSSDLNFTPLTRSDDGTYTCTVTITSPLLNNPRNAMSGSTLTVTHVMPDAPSTLTAMVTATSITITWTQSSDIFIDRYEVSYMYTIRRCSASSGQGMNSISGSARSYTLMSLNEDSTYTITVTAINDEGSRSSIITANTSTSAPSAGPSNVTGMAVEVNTITIEWNEVECAERNGDITSYRVRYGPSSTLSDRNERDTTSRTFSVGGRQIRTIYSFEVAALNGGTVGSYSTTITVTTPVPSDLGFSLNGQIYPNNSIVTITDIEVGDNALYCLSDSSSCCRGSDGMANGEWFFPGGSPIDGGGGSSTADFSRNRRPSAVLLNIRNNVIGPEGLYRCYVIDARNTLQSLYIGIYAMNRGSPSSVSLSYSRSSATLTCTTTGGPATTVTWSKDNIQISSSSSTYQQSQRVTDTTTSTYLNLLTIISTNVRDYNGSFSCNVTNDRAGSSIQSELTLNSIQVIGNRLFSLGETANITCSVPVVVESIEWVNVSSGSVSGVQELVLSIPITVSSNNTRYRCEVNAGIFMDSEEITIEVGGDNLPRVPIDVTVTSTTSSSAILMWLFQRNEMRNETIHIFYGTISKQLGVITYPIQSDQQYSIQLMSLRPGTRYNYQIYSSNEFANRTDGVEYNFKTDDSKSSAITSLTSVSLNGSTLVLNWQPPDSPNGDILYYTVRITDRVVISEQNVMMTSFTATLPNLSAGVPYNVSITPVNLAGPGSINTMTLFTIEQTPSVAPNFNVSRLSPTTIMVSWKRLTLSEARGFITFYFIDYYPALNNKKRQAPDTMRMSVSRDSSSAIIDGLDENLDYAVQVSAGTSAGNGILSDSQIPEPLPADGGNDGVVIGIVVAVILAVVLVVVIVLAVIILMKLRRSKEGKFKPSNSESVRYVNHKKKEKKEKKPSSPRTAKELEVKNMKPDAGEDQNVDEQCYENTEFIVKDRMKPVPIEDFGAHVQRMHADRDRWFELEYNAVEKSPQYDHDIGLIPENKARNRFGNIFPYNFNRVVLKTIPDVEHSDYINASYVDGYERNTVYIGSQGPTENSIEDFWRMIWDGNIPTIVMLTRLFEGKKKCEAYWPENAETPFIPCPGSPLLIEHNTMLPFAEFVIRKMTVSSSDEPDKSPLEVTLFHYLGWPDHGVPANAISMVNFIKRVRKAHPYSKTDILLVHCSAGVGRTGTFITLDSMMERIKVERTINIYEFVKNLRKQRVLMVQTVTQYTFIHNALDELITCGETEIAAGNMRIVIGKNSRTIQGGSMSGFQKQFEILESVTGEIPALDYSNATSEPNIPKNRYQNKIPYNHTRVRLRPSATMGSDYINASFIEGYRQRGAYIATQTPLPNTINDFWRMVFEHEVKCIVMLCKKQEKGQLLSADYWPASKGSTETYGKYVVTLTLKKNVNDYIVRKMDISEAQSRKSVPPSGFSVTHIQYLKWMEDGIPIITAPVLEIANLVQKVQMGSGNKPIVVTCNDGVGRTGAFITIHAQMERMKSEAVVDMFQYIKAIRIQRTDMVSNKDQYQFCHQVLADFLDEFDTYANFKEII